MPAMAQRVQAPLSRLARFGPRTRGDGFWSGLAVGGALGFVCAPCAGPILAAVTSVSASTGPTVQVVLVALAAARGDGRLVIACGTFGITLVIAYGTSTLYHGISGSRAKDALRVACDMHVAAVIRDKKSSAMNAGLGIDVTAALRSMQDGPALTRYLARTLVDGSPHVAEIVDEMVRDAVAYMADGTASGVLRPTDYPYERAAVLTVWSLGALVLHEHLERLVGVDLLTLGQYLRPTPNHLAVERFVTPGEFERYREEALARGFVECVAGPLVRSSYRAEQALARVRPRLGQRRHQTSRVSKSIRGSTSV